MASDCLITLCPSLFLEHSLLSFPSGPLYIDPSGKDMHTLPPTPFMWAKVQNCLSLSSHQLL